MMSSFKKIPMINKNFTDLNPRDTGSFTPKKDFTQTRRSPMYYMYYVTDGVMDVTVNSQKTSYEAGNIVVIPPNNTYTWEPADGKTMSIIWVGFDGRLAEKFEPLAPPNKFAYDGNVFSTMLNCANIENTREEFVASCLFRLLSEIGERSNKRNGDYVRMAKDYIRIQYSWNLTIKDMADAIGIDKRYLSRIFKKQEGITPMDYLTRTRMEHATEFLQLGYRVNETAKLCGYNNPYYFSNLFSSIYNVPPSMYRDYINNSINKGDSKQ